MDGPAVTKRRGFSLIEVMVALSLGAIVTTVAYQVYAMAKHTAVQASVRGQLARDAQLALDLLGNDFVAFGEGVPAGLCGDESCTMGSSLLPILRVGRSSNLVFLADAPLPNSELSGVAVLTRFAADAASADVAVASEVSGDCTPYSQGAFNAFRCDSESRTFIVGLEMATSPEPCAGGLLGGELRRTCPWGLNKWAATSNKSMAPVNLLAVGEGGVFFARLFDNLTFVDVDNYRGIRLLAATAGPATLNSAQFLGKAGGGALITLDRIFWALENATGVTEECDTTNCILKRRQCWGEVADPAAPGFPNAAADFVSSQAELENCTPGIDGTDWEIVLRNIESFAFIYYQGGPAALPINAKTNGLTLAQLPLVRAIQVEMTLAKETSGPGPILRHTVKQRYFLNNRERTEP